MVIDSAMNHQKYHGNSAPGETASARSRRPKAEEDARSKVRLGRFFSSGHGDFYGDL